MLTQLLSAVAGYAATAYLLDVVVTPLQMAKTARELASRAGKPLLCIGSDTPRSSVSSFLFGPQLYGDVNIDLSAPRGLPGPDRVVYGDAMNLDFQDGVFGCAFASHVLEHVSDPEIALREMLRVADYAVVIVPKWWAPHTWLHPGHRWFIAQSFERRPLWLAPVNDPGNGEEGADHAGDYTSTAEDSRIDDLCRD